MNKRKGNIAEVDNYNEDTERISFDIRILKRGVFIASQPMWISKSSELSAESQLRSQIERFSAFIENHKI